MHYDTAKTSEKVSKFDIGIYAIISTLFILLVIGIVY
jgi:hypothetical protein